MLLAHRIRIDPTDKQRSYFAKAAGTARRTWNWALGEWQRQLAAGGRPNAYALKRQFNAIKYTDPGWTPLFVNAAALVLEVGGVLQHGAAVAREYGKPCVAGIADVLTRFSDRQIVEVDGTAGVIRIICAAPTKASAAKLA